MKKTSTNNRRKKLPLLLGALLIISVAAYGTRAYFSNSATQQANIALELGDVAISTEKTLDWVYTPLQTGTNLDPAMKDNNQLVTEKSTDNSVAVPTKYTNVRPGDSFTREYSIKNVGSLDVKVKIDNDATTLGITDETSPVIVKIEEIDSTTILTQNDEKKYNVKITVNPTLDNKYNKRNTKFDQASFSALALDYIAETVAFEAIQTNGVQ